MNPEPPIINWELTLDTILAEKCILFLGPEVFTTADGKTLDSQLLEYIGAADDPDVKVYQDGLFFFRMKQKRTETYLKIRRFFQQEEFPEASALFEKIASIPFHFIITVTPDSQLAKMFEQLQLKFKSDFYWKRQPPDHKMPIPTSQQPLLYDILGNIEKPGSLVLTHDDLYDYLESIFKSQSMSDKLKDHIINEAQSIIFLGLPFGRWYMQLLLRVLHLHKDEEFMRFAASQELTKEIKTLCKEEFKINFVPNNIESFIDELYQRCETRGALRQANASRQSFTQVLKNLMIADRLEEAMQRFRDWLVDRPPRSSIPWRSGSEPAAKLPEPAVDLLDDVTLLASRYRRLVRKITQGVLSREESGVETNKIRSALLELINEAEGLE